MGSTGEPDRKRRHFSSISPTETAAKKQPPFAHSEDKRIGVPVLQYRYKKLIQQLEAQKVEYFALEGKFHHLVEKQATYGDTLGVISESWEQLVGDLESHSVSAHESEGGGCDMKTFHEKEDGASSCPIEEDFISRLLETGATESCSDVLCPSPMENVRTSQATTRNILENIVASINCLWCVNIEAVSALCMTLPEDESNIQLRKSVNDLQVEVQGFQVAIHDLHLKHKSLANKVQYHRDKDVKNKAELKLLSGELASTIAELEVINCKMANLKAQIDAAPGAPFLFPPSGNKQADGEKLRDKQKELQDLELTLKDMKDVASSRLVDIRSLHEERIRVLKRLADLQGAVTDVQSITSSKAFLLLIEQLNVSMAEMGQSRTSLEKLQVEKDSFIWHEKEVSVRADLADAYQRFSTLLESHIAKLEQNLQKLLDERILLEGKLEQASKKPGRKEIIAEFKSLVSSLPKDMAVMQSELGKYKEAASEIHCLRADVQSFSSILERKVSQLELLSGRSDQQFSEIKKLEAVVRELRDRDQELELILEMCRRESTDTREVMESRDAEYKAWSFVQSLKSSLDEHNLELRVKEAIEEEAILQQRLATTEAEIADLRQNLESSGRGIRHSSEALKSKHEEGETYLSEIESIGQAYEDMQTQNHQLLLQVTERDDYNIKLVMEETKARQLHDALSREVHTMDRKLQHANSFYDLFHSKVVHFEDQLKNWSDQVGRLVEDDGWHYSTSLANAQSRLTDIESEHQQILESLGERQSQAAKSRLDVAELLVELEKEKFNKRRIEEGFEVMTRKATSLREQMEGSTVLGKLKQEIKEYRGILKCRICQERQKEVVIAKCYHLFCSECVQRTLESRHRKCPSCGVSFGPNDVKPVYI